jgi:hypothetical protein
MKKQHKLKIIKFFGKLYLIPVLILATQLSCKKDWLDAKPAKSLIVPSSLNDYQQILDNTNIFNNGLAALPEISADNYYTTYANWQSSGSALERNTYTWAKDLFAGETVCPDWTNAYRNILYANIILEGLTKIDKTPANEKEYNSIKGGALFHRANNLYNLAQLFCPPYQEQTANNQPGLPLRLNPNVNEHTSRANLKTTYDQIISDLSTASQLLPEIQPYLTRPSKNSAYAMLARVNLATGNYSQALEYADRSLHLNNQLLDFSSLNQNANFPFTLFNKEVIFHSAASTSLIVSGVRFNVDTTLYRSYDDNDLRKTCYYRLSGTEIKYKGSYVGNNSFFNGLAVDEMLLTRSECKARANHTTAAMSDLNTLLKTRWKIVNGTSTYIDKTAANAEEALVIILKERRKELPFRELRWTDLRRLNQTPAHATTLTRGLNGVSYSLPPNDPRYTLPIPPNEIISSGIEQNQR